MEELSRLILLVHAASTLYMLGLVWFVQRVHYPLFAEVGARGFRRYEREHLDRTGPVVAPPMIIEALSGCALVAWPPDGVASFAPWLGLGLLGLVWLSTWAFQIPRHRELERGFDRSAHRRLVASNWIRTFVWSLRSGLVLWMMYGFGSFTSS